VYHLYGGCEAGDGLQHAHRVTVVEGLAESLQGVHVLQVILCLIGSQVYPGSETEQLIIDQITNIQ